MSNGSWRVDEAYVRVKGRWTYLYRAVDSRGQTIDFLLAARRDTAAAKRFFRKAMAQPHVTNPRTLTVDKNPAYPQSGRRYEKRRSAIAPHLSAAMQIPQQHRRARPPAYQAPCPARARLRQFPYRAANFGGFRNEAMMRKGQLRQIDGHDIRGQAVVIADLFDSAA